MICIPIAARTTGEALEKMARAASLADVVELRIDRMGEVDLPRLLGQPRPAVIVTNRRFEERGGFAGTEQDRTALLAEAARMGADYLDIETATDPAMKETLRQICASSRVKRIASWHDFTGTPSREFLRRKLAECVADRPAIVKMVTLAVSPEDSLRLLELIPRSRRTGQEIAAFCMGEKGKFGRIAAHLMGAALSFASLEEGETSAPGQLTARQMREVLGILAPASSPLPASGPGSEALWP